MENDGVKVMEEWKDEMEGWKSGKMEWWWWKGG